MSQYFPKPCEPFGDLSKLSDVVENDVVKKTAYDILVAKVNSTDTSAFVLKTKYDIDKIEIKIKIPNTTDLVKETDYNTKITEIEGKIPDVSNLATKTALTTVENKIPDISNLATKTALTIVENKIPDISNLATKTALTTVENKIPSVSNLATKTALTTVENKIPDVSSLVKKTDYNTRVAEIDTKVSSLDAIIAKNKNELIKNVLENTAFGILLLFMVNAMFDGGDGLQAYLIFRPGYKDFKTTPNTDYISSWNSKELSAESINI